MKTKESLDRPVRPFEIEVECEWCGKKFVTRRKWKERGKGRFCSRECHAEWQRGRTREGEKITGRPIGLAVERQCERCGKTFWTKPSKVKKGEARFCGKVCYGQWRSEALKGENHPNYNQIERQCEICGTTFYSVQSQIDKGWARFCSQECAAVWRSGETSPCWKGGPREFICEQCGIAFQGGTHLERDRRFCSQKCMGAWYSENIRGEDHHAWLGGIADEPYGPGFTDTKKEEIRARDDYKCQLCGEPQNGIGLPVHHIDYDKWNSDSLNLITLCPSCHTPVHYNRPYWQARLSTMMWTKYGTEQLELEMA